MQFLIVLALAATVLGGLLSLQMPLRAEIRETTVQARADHVALLLSVAQTYVETVPYAGPGVERITWPMIRARMNTLPVPEAYRSLNAPPGWVLLRDANDWRVCAEVDAEVLSRLFVGTEAPVRANTGQVVLGVRNVNDANRVATGCP